MSWEKQFAEFAGRLQNDGLPLAIRLWNGDTAIGSNPAVVISVPTLAALRHLFNPTLDSLGRAYVEGKIEIEGCVHDIVNVATRLVAYGKHSGIPSSPNPFKFLHTRKTDADAIAYHYDVSNEFYSLWLDRNMVYSCGYFITPQDSIETAQIQKIDHILDKVNIQPGDRLLDIGCGWGGLIMRAAEKYGAKALGITLSQNQYEFAKERISTAGLSDRCEVRIQDYRDVTGKFERITSVGMFEHVGLKNLRSYFAKIESLLTDNGVVMNHGITSCDVDSKISHWGADDFMDNYVFPDSETPHIALTLKEMCGAGLEPVDVENLRRHYVYTLNHWTERFEQQSDRLRAIAGEKRYRIWRLYLAGCAYGFAQNWISLHQILAVKAGFGALPLTRDYIYQ